MARYGKTIRGSGCYAIDVLAEAKTATLPPAPNLSRPREITVLNWKCSAGLAAANRVAESIQREAEMQ